MQQKAYKTSVGSQFARVAQVLHAPRKRHLFSGKEWSARAYKTSLGSQFVSVARQRNLRATLRHLFSGAADPARE
jgi:hypothetical protein